jgi:hypothetical protein
MLKILLVDPKEILIVTEEVIDVADGHPTAPNHFGNPLTHLLGLGELKISRLG